MKRLRFRSLLVAACLATAPVALAQPKSDESRQEARERFDRGLRLFNAGDNGGALAEFQKAYEIVHHPVVLYNIALVYVAMGQPVLAVEAFDQLAANPGALDADKAARAKSERAEAAARIGTLDLAQVPAGATIEVDNVEIGKTPLPKPLQVASGTRLLTITAPGYLPARLRVTVAGQSTAVVEPKLQAISGQPAQVEVKTKLLGAEVLVDGELVGVTPLPASLAIAPGTRNIEVRRAGYTSAKQTLTLGEGSRGTVNLEPELDASKLGSEGGQLALAISEPDAVVFVDDVPVGPYQKPISLPHGKHALRIERADFFPVSRVVDVPKGSSVTIQAELAPTPEKRAAYRGKTTSQRTWGWITTGTGAVILAGSGGFLFWNKGQDTQATSDFDDVVANAGPGKPCDPMGSGDHEVCQVEQDLALQKVDDVRARYKFGFIGLAVGAVTTGVGIALLATNDDPDRYEPKAESDVFGRLRVQPVGWLDRQSGGLGLVGAF